mgnify:CR=1 FL=1
MKPVKLFYQERCPFCKKALRYIEELKEEHPEFQPIEIEMIEENQHPDIADQYDYYYVPYVLCGRCRKYMKAGYFTKMRWRHCSVK